MKEARCLKPLRTFQRNKQNKLKSLGPFTKYLVEKCNAQRSANAGSQLKDLSGRRHRDLVIRRPGRTTSLAGES